MNKNNQTGFPGVYFDTKAGKYRSQISVFGKKIKIGTFQTPEEASRARKIALKEYDLKNYKVLPLDLAIAHFVMQHELGMKRGEAVYQIMYNTFATPSLLYAFVTYKGERSFFPYAVKIVTQDLKERIARSVYNPYIFTDLLEDEDKQILTKYLCGNSIGRIAKWHNMSYSTAYRRIENIKEIVKKGPNNQL